MSIAIVVNHAVHQAEHGEAVRAGFVRHGLESRFTGVNTVLPDADLHVVWGAPTKHPAVVAWAQETGRPILVMERGHVGDRFNWTSLGWNGLGRRGTYARVADDGQRWRDRWAQLREPWRQPSFKSRRVLLIGQVTGDAALYHLPCGFHRWAQDRTDELTAAGYTVCYRAHPGMLRRGIDFCPAGAVRSTQERLWDDLAGVDYVVTFNSTAGVECVLAGVPTVTLDVGAMAWEVTSHDPLAPDAHEPDRLAWAHRLAWTQFAFEEIRSGTAWEALAACRPEGFYE